MDGHAALNPGRDADNGQKDQRDHHHGAQPIRRQTR